MLKRGIDIVVAGAMLVFCLPLLAVCGLLVKLGSRVPVLFRQIRTGRNFSTFRLLKLRTMRVGENGPAIAVGIDPRITHLEAGCGDGKWMSCPSSGMWFAAT